MMPGLVLTAIAGFLAVGAAGVPLAHHRMGRPLVYGASGALSTILFLAAGYILLTAAGPSAELVLPLGLPWIGAHFQVDSLSAAFLVVVNLGAAAASLFGLGDGRHEEAPQRVLPFYPLFLAGMNLVVLAADAFTFLFSWEFMSLASWALVMAHHRAAGNVRAGYVYLMMAGFGTLMLLLAFGLLAGHAGTYEFGMMRVSAPSPMVASVVLALALLGAGSKAGLVPLHVWLPLAHPAGPGHL
jgi:hydrogenase-4 component B